MLSKLGSMPADLDALVALMPFAGNLGLVLDEASPDRVIARLDWAPHLCTSGGLMHGGVLMSLADTVGALVAFLGLPPGATTATITSTTQMFRPVSSGTVRAVAVPLHRGRTMVTAQTSLHDSAERLIAQTTQIQAVRAPGHAAPLRRPSRPQRRGGAPDRVGELALLPADAVTPPAGLRHDDQGHRRVPGQVDGDRADQPVGGA